MNFLYIPLIIFLFTAHCALGQNVPEDRKFVVKKLKSDDEIHLDGILDEVIWGELEGPNNFWQYFPSDSLRSTADTDIKMGYTDDYLYVGITCYSVGNDFIVPSLKRDFRAGGNDNITLLFDSFNDGANAVFFGTNPYGVLREGLISGGGQGLRDFTTSWDNKWQCQSSLGENMWYAEIKIPFSILRFNAGETKWRFNSYRFDMQSNERSSYFRIPQNQIIFSLSFMGDMVWEEPLKSSNSVVSLIPFVAGQASKDYEANENADATASIGGDAKIAVTSGLNLDLTLNPDFSQVEVDRQITDLSRFEIFFPERRQFFLENADLFSGYGFSRINPFFSRRIGVATDTITNTTVQNTIYAGARLSGKLNPDWRLGLMNMQTANNDQRGIVGSNFGAASIQRKVGQRSFIGAFLINKQKTGNVDNVEEQKYNRVVGMDFNLATSDNSWVGKTFLHRSMGEYDSSDGWSHGGRFTFTKRKFQLDWQHEYVGETFNAEVGFVPRTNYRSFEIEGRLFYYPNTSLVNIHGPSIRLSQIGQPGIGKTDQEIELSYQIRGQQRDNLNISILNTYVYLFSAFDPTGTDSEKLPIDTDYSYTALNVNYSSDQAKVFSIRAGSYLGQYFAGNRQGLNGGMQARFQPHLLLGMNFAINRFDMDYLDDIKYTYLIGPNVDITFSKKVFLTTFLQYNSQSQNTNVNMRLQYRFAPVSDFFLVWTDNYFTGTENPADRFMINVRNRSVVAKFTYWLNI